VNFVPPPSKLPVGCNYHLFREGIMPMWEVPPARARPAPALRPPRPQRARADAGAPQHYP